MKRAAVVSFVAGAILVAGARAGTVTLIDDLTPGYYNNSLGTLLDGTNPIPHPSDPTRTLPMFQYPLFSPRGTDVRIDPVPYEPNLSVVGAILGDWLTDPTSLNSYWSGPMTIPQTWPVNTETAIIYEVDAGPYGMVDVVASFGVDNGVFLWVDGVFLYGGIRPGHAIAGEHVVQIGTLSPGKHYFQVLREDHGVITGYTVLVTGTPAAEPWSVLLLSVGWVFTAVWRSRRPGEASAGGARASRGP